MNPSLTLTFCRLGKVAPWDAVIYGVFQLPGGLSGVLMMSFLAGRPLADPAINYVVTVPGPAGVPAAWVAEFAMSLLQMLVVLCVSGSRAARWTGSSEPATVHLLRLPRRS